MKASPFLLALALASLAATAYVAFSPTGGTLTLPTLLETTALEGTLTTPEGLAVSPSAAAFGRVRPGTQSAPVEITVRNGGLVPLTIALATTPMRDAASGVSFPADALTVTRDATGSLVPGGSLTLTLALRVPSGAEQWIPPGAYAGALHVTYEAVSP